MSKLICNSHSTNKQYEYLVKLKYYEEQYVTYVYELKLDKPIDEEMKNYHDLNELIQHKSQYHNDIDSWITCTLSRGVTGQIKLRMIATLFCLFIKLRDQFRYS